MAHLTAIPLPIVCLEVVLDALTFLDVQPVSKTVHVEIANETLALADRNKRVLGAALVLPAELADDPFLLLVVSFLVFILLDLGLLQ